MKKSFAAGAIAGMSSLALAVPLLAQISSAATDSSASTNIKADRPAPSIACVQALAAKDDAMLATIDTMMAAHKSATQARRDALKAGATITDDAARKAAVQAADEAFYKAMQTAMESQKDDASMDALKEACGDSMGGMHFKMAFGGPMGGHMKMRGPGPEMLAEKLGLTAEELKAALESGKSIEDIATEKGVTLPARPEGKGNFMMRFKDQAQTSSAQ